MENFMDSQNFLLSDIFSTQCETVIEDVLLGQSGQPIIEYPSDLYQYDGQGSCQPAPGSCQPAPGSCQPAPGNFVQPGDVQYPSNVGAQQVQANADTEIWPPQLLGPQDQTTFPGQYNFFVEMTAANSAKLTISEHLNKIYVQPNMSIPFKFLFDEHTGSEMFVRATILFTNPAFAADRVHCCRQHQEDLPDDRGLHVLQSRARAGVQYQGRLREAEAQLSVVARLPPAGPRAHTYRFVCKNSCPSGIQRRDIGIFFNLEDAQGNVCGRQMFNVCVSSCPKRDKRNAEEAKVDENHGDAASKRLKRTKQPGAASSKRVKVKTECPAYPGCILPQVDVGNPRIAIAGLEMMVHMIRQQMTQLQDEADRPNWVQRLRSLLDNIDELKRRLDESA